MTGYLVSLLHFCNLMKEYQERALSFASVEFLGNAIACRRIKKI